MAAHVVANQTTGRLLLGDYHKDSSVSAANVICHSTAKRRYCLTTPTRERIAIFMRTSEPDEGLAVSRADWKTPSYSSATSESESSAGKWTLDSALGPVSRKSRELFVSESCFMFAVYALKIKVSIIKLMKLKLIMKLSVNKAKLTGLWARNCGTIQLVLISKFTFGPEKLSGLSRNGPSAVPYRLSSPDCGYDHFFIWYFLFLSISHRCFTSKRAKHCSS